MCHEILHFFLFLPIENVKLSLDSWAIGNQKACGVGWRIPMHYPLCISPQQSIKVRFKYLDVLFISLLHPQFQAFHRHFLKSGSSDSSTPYSPPPPPQGTVCNALDFFYQNLPVPEKTAHCNFFQILLPRTGVKLQCLHAPSFSKHRSGHHTALFPGSCHLSLILQRGPYEGAAVRLPIVMTGFSHIHFMFKILPVTVQMASQETQKKS